MKTKLQTVIELLGFKGGTIHQVNRALSEVTCNCDLYELDDIQWHGLVAMLKSKGPFYQRMLEAFKKAI
jgi:hypothetical protein